MLTFNFPEPAKNAHALHKERLARNALIMEFLLDGGNYSAAARKFNLDPSTIKLISDKYVWRKRRESGLRWDDYAASFITIDSLRRDRKK